MAQAVGQGILSNLDFTINKYDKLCEAITESKYTSITLADYLELPDEKRDHPYLIMRHDIDRSPQLALGTAQVESNHHIQATYYFRMQKATYVTDIIDKIAALGHEIGYHYETIDKCKGDLAAAKELFRKELAVFRLKYEVKTVCAHGNPLTSNDNKDIWNDGFTLADQGLLGEAFFALDFTRFAYFSDSGRTWLNNKSQKMPGKDSVETSYMEFQPKSTEDIIKIIRAGILPNICVLAHSERWSREIIGFSRRYLMDLAFSWGKVAIYTYRKAGK